MTSPIHAEAAYIDEKHKHIYNIPKSIKIPIASYRQEDGAMKYQGTRGFDILKQLVCECGDVETVDMERTILA